MHRANHARAADGVMISAIIGSRRRRPEFALSTFDCIPEIARNEAQTLRVWVEDQRRHSELRRKS